MPDMSPLIAQAARDLRWLIACPDLLESPLALELPDPFSSKAKLDFSPVERFFETKASHRVGYYVESLVQVWLESTPGISEVQRGIQIREGKETLGELDFLFEREGELHHLEVALKFYLYSPDREVHGSHFIGPNAADTFERKRDRLLDKQVPLGKVSHPEISWSHVMVKGMIFYRPDETRPEILPVGLNPNHSRGIWVKDGVDIEVLRDLRGTVLQKPFWLAGPEMEGGIGEDQCAAESTPISHPQFYRLHESHGNGAMAGQRLFVVPEGWTREK